MGSGTAFTQWRCILTRSAVRSCRTRSLPDRSICLIDFVSNEAERWDEEELPERCTLSINTFLSIDTDWFRVTGIGQVQCKCGWRHPTSNMDAELLTWHMLEHHMYNHQG